MISYSQFCPVAKAAEVFGDRWTPIIMRELCFGPRAFGELLAAAPLISRTVLAQRLRELSDAGVVSASAKTKGKGHLYQLPPAGEDFRPIVELLSVWGQQWGQGLIGPDDLDPGMLVWGMRRQIDQFGHPTAFRAQHNSGRRGRVSHRNGPRHYSRRMDRLSFPCPRARNQSKQPHRGLVSETPIAAAISGWVMPPSRSKTI
jgi:DNA-binding HxlR family transcriptional regulator